MTPKALPLHPLCAAFPLLSGPAMDILVESIRTNGQKEPILV